MLAAGNDNAYHGGALSDIRQRNQRPHWRATHALNHLQINSKGGLVYAGDHQRRVQEAKQCRTNRSKAAGHQVTYRKGNAIANHATKRTNQSMGEEHREDQRTDGHHHQIEVIWHDAFKASFNNAQRQSG